MGFASRCHISPAGCRKTVLERVLLSSSSSTRCTWQIEKGDQWTRGETPVNFALSYLVVSLETLRAHHEVYGLCFCRDCAQGPALELQAVDEATVLIGGHDEVTVRSRLVPCFMRNCEYSICCCFATQSRNLDVSDAKMQNKHFQKILKKL